MSTTTKTTVQEIKVALATAQVNVFGNLPRKECESLEDAGFAPTVFTSINQSIAEHFAQITDEASLEQLMEDFNCNGIEYFTVAVYGYSHLDQAMNYMLSTIFDNGKSRVIDRTMIPAVSYDAESHVVMTQQSYSEIEDVMYFKGTFSSVMQNFYNFVTKRMSTNNTHLALVVKALSTILSSEFLSVINYVVLDQNGAMRVLAPAKYQAAAHDAIIDDVVRPSLYEAVSFMVDVNTVLKA
jgi:hypothetical protein